MNRDSSWEGPAARYLALYCELAGLPAPRAAAIQAPAAQLEPAAIERAAPRVNAVATRRARVPAEVRSSA